LPFFPPHCGVPSVRFIPRDSGALPMALFPLPFEKVLNGPFYDFIIYDGFVKSPYAVLPFFPPHCGVPSVRFIPRNSGALPLELFLLCRSKKC
ncbi:MAG TPA: hypothetical protein PKW20_08865, partial [Syntrophales bacterium]|nr:hypothetical protein [Syntrophales bacterium]